MPSLLDLIAPTVHPIPGGLLAGPVAMPTLGPVTASPVPALAPQPTLVDRLGTRLFGGHQFGAPRTGLDTLLTPADEHRARQQALLALGATLAQAGAPHVPGTGTSPIAAIAQGLQAGRNAFRESIGQRQQTALQGRALQQDEALQKARAQIAQQFPITPDMSPEEQLQALRGQFAAYSAAGDRGMVTALNSIAPSLFRTPRSPAAARRIVKVGGRVKLIDAATGQEIADLGAAQEGSTARARVLTDKNGAQYVLNADGTVAPLTNESGAPLVKYDAARARSARDTQKALADIDNALALVGKHPDAFGLEHGHGLPVVGGVLDVRTDPEGVAARAAVANIGSRVIHDRSGAAVTVSEFPRLQPFIPAIGDPADVVTRKLTQLRTEYQRIQAQLNNGTPLSDLMGTPASGSKEKRPSLEDIFK